MIIAVEGVDCSGKGSVCRVLATTLGATLMKTPPEHMREEQQLVNATASNAEHYQYFIRVVGEASQQLQAMPEPRNVVIDRYWMTTVVYHRAMGIDADLAHLGNILLPDFTVYLEVSPEAQAVRMADRGMSEGDKRMAARQTLLRWHYDEVLSQQTAVIRVDTTFLTIPQVVEAIISHLPLALAS